MTPRLSVADPELIKNILVKDFNHFMDRPGFLEENIYENNMLFFQKGNHWKTSRAILSPTFTSGKMKQMYVLMEECADDLIGVLDEKSAKHEAIDLKPFFGNYTLDVIAICCFATRLHSNKNPDSEFKRQMRLLFTPKFIPLLIAFTFPQKIASWLDLSFFPKSSMQFFESLMSHILKQRKDNNIKGRDFLQLMMDAKCDPTPDEHQDITTGDEKPNNKSQLDDQEIICQSILFFIAGQETTASLLTFMFYELSKNQHVQNQLRHEIKEETDKNGINYDNLIYGLPYLDACVSETLRMYPPVLVLDRVAQSNYLLGETGIIIEKDIVVEIPVNAIHRDPQYFLDPDTFDPERFMPGNKEKIKQYTYMPFGSGPRSCVGMRFALLEAKLVICKSLLKFKFEMTPETPQEISFQPLSGLLLSKTPVPVYVQHI